MKRMVENYDIPWTMEETGPGRNLTLEVLANFGFRPAEGSVVYADGSACPSVDGTCELLHFRTLEATGEGWELKRDQAPERFQVLDAWLARTIEPNDAA